METASSIGIECSGISEVGPVREENQDAIRMADRTLGARAGFLFGLADGMGGYAHGRIASDLALDALFHAFYSENHILNNESMARLMQKGIDVANLAVCNEARRLGAFRMGTTLTAAAIWGNRLYLAHVGDSRAYIVREGKSTCLTKDHTVVGDLLRMRVLTADQVRTHSRRSVLTKAVGLGLFIQPDSLQLSLHSGDWVILCCDGVWAVIEDDEFAEISAPKADPNSVCRQLIDLALARGSDDNLSVIAIHVGDLQSTANAEAPRGQWLQKVLQGFGRRNGSRSGRHHG